MKALLDTHILLWWLATNSRLSTAQRAVTLLTQDRRIIDSGLAQIIQ